MSRIVAGTWRGRPLATPKGERTRPTSDRVREAVFSALAVWAGQGGDADAALRGLSFLDLFAGSGAMGLEAASRGAAAVSFVEKDRGTARVIVANARDLGFRADVRVESAEAAAARTPAVPYDVVWLDPPYAYPTPDLDAVLADLVTHRVVAPDGLLVVERATRSDPPEFPPGFPQWRVRRYGETTVFYASGEVA